MMTAMGTLNALLGLLFGSFANVLIDRVPRREECIVTPSHCTSCGSRLRWFELIPVLSYALQRGRCRHCGVRIPAEYPLVEAANALLWLVCALAFGLTWFLPVALGVTTCLLALSVIDAKTMEIPDGFSLFLLVLGVLWNVYAAIAGLGVLAENIIGFFAVSVPLLLIGVIAKDSMGGGDIKLMAVCGLLLGWKRILLALGLAAVLGTLVMLPIHLFKKKKRETPIPFGPFLSAGVWLAMCFGGELFGAYRSLFHF